MCFCCTHFIGVYLVVKRSTQLIVIILVVQENEMLKAALIIVKEIKLCFQDLLNKMIFNVRLQNIINYD